LALADGPLIDKTRHFVLHEGFEWEVDEFHGDKRRARGAELELAREDQPFPHPPWLGVEVTELRRYYNVSLVSHPTANGPKPNGTRDDARLAGCADAARRARRQVARDLLGVDVEARRRRNPRQLQDAARPARGSRQDRRGAPLNAVFRGRRQTGEIYSPELARAHPDRDWILTRILGCRAPRSPQSPRACRYNAPLHLYPRHAGYGAVGSPGSIGCIRMANRDLVELFDLVPVGTLVEIA